MNARLPLLFGLIAGVASQLNWAADRGPDDRTLLLVRIGAAALLGPLVLWGVARLLRYLVQRLPLVPAVRARYRRRDGWTYTAFVLPALGAVGIPVGPLVVALPFVAAQLLLLLWPRVRGTAGLGRLAALFTVSGFAALIYQVVWQRVLFTAFGVNIESITVVVSIFIFGLGVGAMVGGWLSRRFPARLVQLFVACELGIGLFGLASLALIRAVSQATLHGTLLQISLAVYALLAVPTILMGATLPILVAHLFSFYRHVGRAVGLLYFVNTIGSALACFATTNVIFVLVGLQASVHVAAACNLFVALMVLLVARRTA